MRALDLYVSIVNGVFITGAKLLYKPSSKKASAEEITSRHSKMANMLYLPTVFITLDEIDEAESVSLYKRKRQGDYKLYYHPLIFSEVLLTSGLWEIYVKRILTVAPDEVFIDVGAHIGTYAIPVAKKA